MPNSQPHPTVIVAPAKATRGRQKGQATAPPRPPAAQAQPANEAVRAPSRWAFDDANGQPVAPHRGYQAPQPSTTRPPVQPSTRTTHAPRVTEEHRPIPGYSGMQAYGQAVPRRELPQHHPRMAAHAAVARDEQSGEVIDIRGYTRLEEDSQVSDYPLEEPSRFPQADVPTGSTYRARGTGAQPEKINILQNALNSAQLESARQQRQLEEMEMRQLEERNAKKVHARVEREGRSASSQQSRPSIAQLDPSSDTVGNISAVLNILTGADEEDWKKCAKRFCFVTSLWLVPKDALQHVDLTAQERSGPFFKGRWANDAAKKDALDADILNAIPESLHKYLGPSGLLEYQEVFYKTINNQRATIVNAALANGAAIFEEFGFMDRDFSSADTRRLNKQMVYLFGAGPSGVHHNPKEELGLLHPIFFPAGRDGDLSVSLRCPWFARLARVVTFGKTSILEDREASPLSSGMVLFIFGATPASLAMALVIAVYLVSPDPSFMHLGSKSKFLYQKEYFAWKKYFIQKWNSERVRDLVSWFNVMIFKGRNPDLELQPTDEDVHMLSRAAALRQALDDSAYDFVYDGPATDAELATGSEPATRPGENVDTSVYDVNGGHHVDRAAFDTQHHADADRDPWKSHDEEMTSEDANAEAQNPPDTPSHRPSFFDSEYLGPRFSPLFSSTPLPRDGRTSERQVDHSQAVQLPPSAVTPHASNMLRGSSTSFVQTPGMPPQARHDEERTQLLPRPLTRALPRVTGRDFADNQQEPAMLPISAQATPMPALQKAGLFMYPHALITDTYTPRTQAHFGRSLVAAPTSLNTFVSGAIESGNMRPPSSSRASPALGHQNRTRSSVRDPSDVVNESRSIPVAGIRDHTEPAAVSEFAVYTPHPATSNSTRRPREQLIPQGEPEPEDGEGLADAPTKASKARKTKTKTKTKAEKEAERQATGFVQRRSTRQK